MLKKTVALLLALMLTTALCAAALGESTYYGSMMVDHCDEWVSLRNGPGTGCERIAKVPLYAVVTDCERGPLTGDFIYCCYDGQWGYILAKYLEPWADPEPEDAPLVDTRLGRLHLMAEHSYIDDGEYLLVTCEDEAGDTVWFREEKTDDITELTCLTAFMAGAAQDPLLMIYNAADDALIALDPFCGEERWRLEKHLGASNSWAADDFGMLYIGGYYGPDPVAIDINGKVLWEADSEGCYWLYKIELRDNALWCWYDVMDGNPDHSGEVIFGLNGAIIEKRYDK